MKARRLHDPTAVRRIEQINGSREAAKSRRLIVPTWAHVAWLSLLSAFLLAGTPDQEANLLTTEAIVCEISEDSMIVTHPSTVRSAITLP